MRRQAYHDKSLYLFVNLILVIDSRVYIVQRDPFCGPLMKWNLVRHMAYHQRYGCRGIISQCLLVEVGGPRIICGAATSEDWAVGVTVTTGTDKFGLHQFPRVHGA